MAKNIDLDKTDETIEITVNEKGQYEFPMFDMYVDEEGNTEKIKLIVQKTYNMGNYNTALFAYMNNADPRAFGQSVFKGMIVYPKKAQNITFWDHDLEALALVANAIVEIMGKKPKTLKRNLNFNL